MRVPDVRKAFDQGEFMHDGPALRFGRLIGSESCQLVELEVGHLSDILVNLFRRSPLLQGDLS